MRRALLVWRAWWLVCALAPFGAVLAAGANVGVPEMPEATEARWGVEWGAGTVASTVDGVTASGPVVLPYHWDRQHGGRPGEAVFDLPFTLAEAPDQPWGLFIARVGNAFDIRLNGHLLQTYGDLAEGGGADYAKAPIYVPLPAHLLQSGANVIQIRIRADTGRRAGLSRLTLGPAKAVRDAYFEPAYAWRFTGSVLLAAFSMLVGAISLALWFTQTDPAAPGDRRRDNLYLWAALAEFCWALRVADGAIRQPPLPWAAWGVLMTACYSGWAGAAVMFCQHLAGWQDRPAMRWLRRGTVLVFTMPVIACYVALTRAEPRWLTGWLALEITAVTAYALFFVAATVRRPNLARVWVASTIVLTVAVAVRDWLVIRLSHSYGDTTWVRYTSLFFALVLLALVVHRFRTASVQARDLLQTLAVRVAERERELAAAYGRLEIAAREQERLQERERILRDMHDGVGAHISAAIRQLQSGRASSEDLLDTLRDSLDQLKLSIDAMHLPAGDVEGVLAGLRYRLAPRFATAGIALEWGVDALEPVARLDVPALRQLQFLLFEAVSNVLQHAQASHLRIEATMQGAAVRIRVIDDGRGFDAARLPRALAARAEAIGARLAVESRPGRTVVLIDIPR
ncbi:sensor histidine kinase [Variovorax ginsengisoli]|uniref:histidine kinase n=1 Tax=Variovorax ginsengisoli TaxID=363844 RepID=A0ABT9SED3_9BURK|nr:ATP-binding protein [Variovorax ginsengisoli]MDP9901717.1 signal transduction histidine kinase [Variovorax ginsengisoli]